MSDYQKIYLVGYNGRTEEAEAAAEITPGQLLELDSDGKVAPHGTAGGTAERAFAVERAEMGETIADTYAVGDQAKYILAVPGDVVWAFLKEGTTVATGGIVTSAGDGSVQPISSDQVPLGVALEAVNNSGGSSPVRVRIRVL